MDSLNEGTAESLLVPMNLAALRVSVKDKDQPWFGKVAVGFETLPRDADDAGTKNQGYLSQAVPENTIAQNDDREPGIHLHWALPDALTRGEHKDDVSESEIAFRPAPNRFLVIRLAGGSSTTQASVDGWVVGSDYQWSSKDDNERTNDSRNRLSRAVPLDPTNPNNTSTYAYQGQICHVSEWKGSASGAGGPHLTAVGYGNGTFAAAYPHCQNVFGFFDLADDLNKLKQKGLSYLVIGWHSDSTCDPIARESARLKAGKQNENKEVTPQMLGEALKANYRWQYDYLNKPKPEQTLYVGQISLEWDPDKAYFPAAKPEIKVALGGTTGEALSAVLASKLKGHYNLTDVLTFQVETILNEFQYDLLNEYTSCDGLPDLQDALHQSDFTTVAAGHDSAKDSGLIWLIKRAGTGNPQQSPSAADLSAAAGALGQPLPPATAEALNKLNRTQSNYDRLVAEVTVRRGQVFVDWEKYIYLKYSRKRVIGDLNTLSAETYIQAEIRTLSDLISVRDQAQKDRDGARDDLTGLLLYAPLNKPSDKEKTRYILEKSAAPRYYQPSDPVILLYGPGVEPSSRYGSGRYGPGNRLCRLSSQITRDLKISGVPQPDLSKKDLSRLTGLADRLPLVDCLPPRDLLTDLIAEAVLLDSQQAYSLASLASNSDRPSNDLVERIRTAQIHHTVFVLESETDAFTADAEISFTGRAPSPIGFVRYEESEQPWIPLILQWEAAFHPFPGKDETDPRCYSTDWVLSNFHLDDDNTEITYSGNDGTSPATYQGMVTLTPNTEINLTGQIDKYLKNHPLDCNVDDRATQFMKNQLKEASNIRLSMMAQAMGGFHRQLLMREQALKLPVFDWTSGLNEPRFLASVRNAVGGEADAVGLPEQDYNPFRAGKLILNKLRLLDAFGQIREIGVPTQSIEFIPAWRLRTDKKSANTSTSALLPLRIAQAARLSFRYRAASNDQDDRIEMNSDPASSPVFGWVLFNKFDNALAIYDARGIAIGSFCLNGLPWQGAPGQGTFGESLERSFESANPHLRALAMNLGGGITDQDKFKNFLKDLICTIDQGAMGIAADSYKQDQGLSLLIGRPLALVRADLRLDLYGRLPAVDQSWKAFHYAVTKGNDSGYSDNDRSSADFAKVRLPVLLGDSARVKDGLVGYFVESASAADTYRTFYAPVAEHCGKHNVLPPPTGAQSLSLAPADNDPVTVTMLVDPRAPVHASTGILPVKSIAIPPANFADALKRIAVTFLAAPVLGAADSLDGAERLALHVPNEVGHGWTWLTLQADQTWHEDAVVSPNSRAAFSAPPRVSEGWLRLSPKSPTDSK